MHSRIKELALEAGIVLKRPSKSWSKNPDWMKTNPNMPMEKFAELLIRECAKHIADQQALVETNWQCKDGIHIVHNLKKHFGIEE